MYQHINNVPIRDPISMKFKFYHLKVYIAKMFAISTNYEWNHHFRMFDQAMLGNFHDCKEVAFLESPSIIIHMQCQHWHIDISATGKTDFLNSRNFIFLTALDIKPQNYCFYQDSAFVRICIIASDRDAASLCSFKKLLGIVCLLLTFGRKADLILLLKTSEPFVWNGFKQYPKNNQHWKHYSSLSFRHNSSKNLLSHLHIYEEEISYQPPKKKKKPCTGVACHHSSISTSTMDGRCPKIR